MFSAGFTYPTLPTDQYHIVIISHCRSLYATFFFLSATQVGSIHRDAKTRIFTGL